MGFWVTFLILLVVVCGGGPTYYRIKDRHLSPQERGRQKNLRRAGTEVALAQQQARQPILTCPTCGGHNVQRQSAAKKLGKVAAIGVFAIPSASKQFKFRDCRCTW